VVPRLPSLDTGPVTGAPSLVAVLMLLQGLEGREGIFLPSCFLSFLLSFLPGRAEVGGPGPRRWVAVLPSALVPGEALCSMVDPLHGVPRLVLCPGLGAGGRCQVWLGCLLACRGQTQLLPGTSWGCFPPGLQARSVRVCFINPSHCNDS
jgi:hypothetical protein